MKAKRRRNQEEFAYKQYRPFCIDPINGTYVVLDNHHGRQVVDDQQGVSVAPNTYAEIYVTCRRLNKDA